jgi:hypothetical protein
MDPIDTCDYCLCVRPVQFIENYRVCEECVGFLNEAQGPSEEDLDAEEKNIEEVGF